MKKIFIAILTLICVSAFPQSNQYLRGNNVWIQTSGGDSTRVKFELGNNAYFPNSTDLYTHKELGFFSKGYVTTNLSGITVDSFLVSTISKNNLGSTYILINHYPHSWFVGSWNNGLKNSLTLDSSTSYGFYYSGALGSYYFPRTQPTSGQALVASDNSGTLGWTSVATAADLNLKLNIVDTGGHWLNNVCRKTGTDSLFQRKGSTLTFITKVDTTGSGGGVTSVNGNTGAVTVDLQSASDAGSGVMYKTDAPYTILSTNGGGSIASQISIGNAANEGFSASVYDMVSYGTIPYAELKAQVGGVSAKMSNYGNPSINPFGWVINAVDSSIYFINGVGDTIYIPPSGNVKDTLATRDYVRANAGGGGSGWGLTGNSGTNSGANYIGTSDNASLSIRANGVEAIYVDSSTQNVGIGTSAPDSTLTVNGSLNVTGNVFMGNSADASVQIDKGTKAIYFTVNNATAISAGTNGGDFGISGISSGLRYNTTGLTTLGDADGNNNGITFNVDDANQKAYLEYGNFGIGTSSPAASAKVEISSTTQGFLPPRMTGTQAEAISSPAEGLLIYSTDGSGSTITSKGWWGWNGSAWVKLN